MVWPQTTSVAMIQMAGARESEMALILRPFPPGDSRRQSQESTVQNIRTSFVTALALCAVGAMAICGNAQQSAPAHNAPPAFQDHVAAAKLLAAQDLTGRNLYDCMMPPRSAAPTTKPVMAPPTKVFDQLYYLGTDIVASWALVTSDGIIQIDSLDNPEESQRIIIGGYKKLGLDPAQMKYLVLTHGHDDHFGGSKYLQDTYHP